MRIVIPTYNRFLVKQQHTLRYLPKELMKDTWIVIQEQQLDDYADVIEHYGCNVHTLPPGSQGIALARKQIAQWLKGSRYWVIEDDMSFAHITWGHGTNGSNGNDYKVNRKPDIEMFRLLFNDVNSLFDQGLVIAALQCNGIPQAATNINVCFRVYTNVFYSENLPVDELDWGETYSIMPEDFHVALQLINKGYSNVVFQHYRTQPATVTHAAGGCSDYRDLQNHNLGQQTLADLYPDYVKVYDKDMLNGPYAGQSIKGLRIRWKQAWIKQHGALPVWKV